MDGFLEIAGAELSQDAANVNQIHAEFRDSQPTPVTRPRTPARTSVDESEERNTKLRPVTGSTRKTVGISGQGIRLLVLFIGQAQSVLVQGDASSDRRRACPIVDEKPYRGDGTAAAPWSLQSLALAGTDIALALRKGRDGEQQAPTYSQRRTEHGA